MVVVVFCLAGRLYHVRCCPSIEHMQVGEINCPCAPFEHPDPVMVRNHAPERTVLGIIARDGAMAGYVCLPANNLHLVPDKVPAQHAAFAEPLAAACRIVEQQVRQLLLRRSLSLIVTLGGR